MWAVRMAGDEAPQAPEGHNRLECSVRERLYLRADTRTTDIEARTPILPRSKKGLG